MSNLYSRLHNLFTSPQKTSKLATELTPKPKLQQTQKPKPTTTTTLSDQVPNKVINQKIKELLAEKNPQTLLEKFTYLSQFHRFRRCHPLYKITIHRLALAEQHDLIEQALESQKIYINGSGFAARIMHLYGKYGMFNHARKVFDEMPEPILKENANCFSALLESAVNSGELEKVNELFRVLPEKLGVKPNEDCYSTTMHALCQLNLFYDALLLFDEMVANGIMPSFVTYNTLLRVYYAKGEFEEGEKLWERMIKSGVSPNIFSYNFKLEALVNDGKIIEAMELFMDLESKGLKPDTATYNTLIQGFCKEDNLDCAKKWYDQLTASGCEPNKITFSALVPFLCDKGEYGMAFEVTKTMFKGRYCSVDEAALQKLVDGLAKNSMVEHAKTVVKLGTSGYCSYNLVMPSTVL